MRQTAAIRPASAILLVAGMLTLASVHAQQAPTASPVFEVASIKRNNSGEGNMTRGMQPGGRMTFVNVPLRQLIIAAYQVQPYQISGGPSWLNSDRFDIIAKAEGNATPEQTNLMLRSLLADRFKLVVHTEQREMSVYSLVKARPDGKLGDKLTPAAVDCGPGGRGRGGPPPAPPTGPGAARGPQGPLMGCGAMIAPGRIIMSGQPVAQFATLLGNQVGRPVIDKTGLSGGYDLEVVFLPEGGRGGPVGAPPPGAPPLPPIDPDAPSLFTALQEQLGLKLESERGPVDVIVIDSVQQPTED
jgi:bla regulator protein blaR1